MTERSYCSVSQSITRDYTLDSEATMPSKPRRSVYAKTLLSQYTRYSKCKATFSRLRRRHHQQLGPRLKRSLRDELQFMSSEVKLVSKSIPEQLQLEHMDVSISETFPSPASLEDLSDYFNEDTSENEDTPDGTSYNGDSLDDSELSDEDLLDDDDFSDEDLRWTLDSDEDDTSSDTSSDDDRTPTYNEPNATDSEDVPSPTSFRTRIFNDLKLMYAHRYEKPHRRLPKPPQPFLKHVLEILKTTQPDYFRNELRVSPLTFDRLVEAIATDPVFASRSSHSRQAPVCQQLAVALYRFGHYGNAASLQSVANWAGIGKGTVSLYTCRVMVALLQPEFMTGSVHWPSEEEKEVAKRWVQHRSCRAWRDGWCFVDGTLIPLANRPYWYGESYFDRKCRYSLNVQVCFC